MKKLLPIISMLLLVTVLVGSLVSCSKYPALKKAFEKEGYTENETLATLAETIKTELEKEELAVTLHLLTKENKITSVLIIEFNATEDLVKAYEESDSIQSLVKGISENEDVKKVFEALEEAGYAKGNCLCVPLSLLYVSEITGIVKSV